MRNNVWRPQFSTLHNLKCQASILADNDDDDNNDDEDKDEEDIYYDEVSVCLCVMKNHQLCAERRRHEARPCRP